MLPANKIIAAVRNEEELSKAAMSNVKIIFDLNPDILSLEEHIAKAHTAGKKFFIHFDLAEGLGKDCAGIEYVGKTGVDGIISTRTNIIRLAREAGIFTVQRFFIVDSHSIGTTVEALKSSKAKMIEIMPGNVLKVIRQIKNMIDVPIIAGGLIETSEEALQAIESGASAVSTSKESLWNIR